MTHTADHDPLLDYPGCAVCHQALTTVWVRFMGQDTAERVPVEEAVPKLRRMLLELLTEEPT